MLLIFKAGNVWHLTCERYHQFMHVDAHAAGAYAGNNSLCNPVQPLHGHCQQKCIIISVYTSMQPCKVQLVLGCRVSIGRQLAGVDFS